MKLLPKSFFIVFVAVLLSGCTLFGVTVGPKTPEPTNRKQLINILPIKDRPFVAIFPHSTNKLITLYFDKVGSAKNITIDLEYLSGNALKGGRTSINNSSFPYTQAFLLGSCSAGGKCSFDTDITTGTVKTKLEVGSELHLLKSNFAFITPDTNATSDQKASFKPTGKSKATLILSQTHGYLSNISQEVAAEPVVITSTSTDALSGTLTITAADATSALIFNGSSYQPAKVKKEGDKLIIDIGGVKPWSKSVTIVRDDLKGSSEEATLNLVGPIVPVK